MSERYLLSVLLCLHLVGCGTSDSVASEPTPTTSPPAPPPAPYLLAGGLDAPALAAPMAGEGGVLLLVGPQLDTIVAHLALPGPPLGLTWFRGAWSGPPRLALWYLAETGAELAIVDASGQLLQLLPAPNPGPSPQLLAVDLAAATDPGGGSEDLLFCAARGLWIFENHAEGHLRHRRLAHSAGGPCATGDLDRDGHTDLVAACERHGACWWRNDGEGHLTAAPLDTREEPITHVISGPPSCPVLAVASSDARCLFATQSSPPRLQAGPRLRGMAAPDAGSRFLQLRADTSPRLLALLAQTPAVFVWMGDPTQTTDLHRVSLPAPPTALAAHPGAPGYVAIGLQDGTLLSRRIE